MVLLRESHYLISNIKKEIFGIGCKNIHEDALISGSEIVPIGDLEKDIYITIKNGIEIIYNANGQEVRPSCSTCKETKNTVFCIANSGCTSCPE